MDMAKLITALEAAGEGSEYLDYAIQRRSGLMKPVPPFTRSIDAALTLIPAGWSIHRLTHRHDCRGSFVRWFAELYRANEAVIQSDATAMAASPALAICAAALRIVDMASARRFDTDQSNSTSLEASLRS